MPLVPYRLHDFPSSLCLQKSGQLRVTQAELIRTAATIGVTPFGRGANRRPTSFDLTWRAAMASANLDEDVTRWVRSESYIRMNPTEKAAVSYFLGQIQAKLAAEQIFGISAFAHFESYLEAIGEPRNKSRPDFIGFSRHGDTFVTVEAKGRFGNHPAETFVQRAKKQVQGLTGPSSNGSDYVYAHVAHFGGGVWAADLHDPPRTRQSDEPDWAAVCFAHYWPVVAAINERRQILAATTRQADAQELQGTRSARFPEVGFTLGVPEAIADAVTRVAPFALGGGLLERRRHFAELLGIAADLAVPQGRGLSDDRV